MSERIKESKSSDICGTSKCSPSQRDFYDKYMSNVDLNKSQATSENIQDMDSSKKKRVQPYGDDSRTPKLSRRSYASSSSSSSSLGSQNTTKLSSSAGTKISDYLLLSNVSVDIDLTSKIIKARAKAQQTEEHVNAIWSTEILEGDHSLMSRINDSYLVYVEKSKKMFKNASFIWECTIHPDHAWRHLIEIINFSPTLSLVQLKQYILPSYETEEIIQFIFWINSHTVSPIATDRAEYLRHHDLDDAFELNYNPKENLELSEQTQYILRYYFTRTVVVDQIGRQCRFCTWWYFLFLEHKTTDHMADPLKKFMRVVHAILGQFVDTKGKGSGQVREAIKIFGRGDRSYVPKHILSTLRQTQARDIFIDNPTAVLANYLDIVNLFFWCSQSKRYFDNGVYVTSNILNLSRLLNQVGINRKRVDIVLNEVHGTKSVIINKFIVWRRKTVYDHNLQNVALDLFEHNQPCLDADFVRENTSTLDSEIFNKFPQELEILGGFVVESMIPYVTNLHMSLVPSVLLYNPLAGAKLHPDKCRPLNIDLQNEPIFEYQPATENELDSSTRVYVPSAITFQDMEIMCKRLTSAQCISILDHPLIVCTCNVILSLAHQYGYKFLTNFHMYYFGEKNKTQIKQFYFNDFKLPTTTDAEHEQSTIISSCVDDGDVYDDSQNQSVIAYLLAQMAANEPIQNLKNDKEAEVVLQEEDEAPIELTLIDEYHFDESYGQHHHENIEKNNFTNPSAAEPPDIDMRRSTFFKFIDIDGKPVPLHTLGSFTLSLLVRNILLLLRNRSTKDLDMLNNNQSGSIFQLRKDRLSVLNTLRKKIPFQPGIISRLQDLTDCYTTFILEKCKEVLGLITPATASTYPLPQLKVADANQVWKAIGKHLKCIASAAIFFYPYCFENEEVLDYFLKYLKGHEIVGQWHKKIVLLYGNSDSGKSFFLNLIRKLFKAGDNFVIACGSFAKSAPGDLNQTIVPFSENMMLYIEEPPVLAASVIKQFVSDAPLGSRHIFTDNFYSRFPNAKMWCSSNMVPIIYNCDQGINTRFLVFHYMHKFLPLAEYGQMAMDRMAPPELALQISRQRYVKDIEESAIIDGLYLLLRTYLTNLIDEENGTITLLIPKIVEDETARVLRQMDPYLQFGTDIEVFEDCTKIMSLKKLRSIIKMWLKNNSYVNVNTTTMTNNFLNRFREQYSHLATMDGHENYHCTIEIGGKKM